MMTGWTMATAASATTTTMQRAEAPMLVGYSFEMYMAEHPMAAAHFVSEGVDREAVFAKRMAVMVAHNARYAAGEETWFMGPNLHTALTDAERAMVRGHQAELKQFAGKHAQEYPVEAEVVKARAAAAPSHVDWRDHSPSIVTAVKNQGMCGSCWSFATAETLESHYALATGKLQALSEQQVLETPNPQACGGTGGCGGGIPQLAYDYMVDAWNGTLGAEWTYPYESFFGKNFPPVSNSSAMKAPAAKLSGYVQLPLNDLDTLIDAIANVGPVAITVDASNWHDYAGGVFTGCNKTDIHLDHDVQLMGYGDDPHLGPYWLIRNSWSPTFGEVGYIRIARHSTPQCAKDTHPEDGFACKGGKKTITVCGECGILSDSCYPIPVVA
ncbi:papain family cysteine protease containing protein [Thecamonas trahens ATCC 50062]|uniref:Papain family cysteine protease containing protein n=1 Tax=Thecamonas trahens ATCC 50062 TaxID=461836 RepID=A0A0L0DMZ6_THETB|nr:papain family cysteine protease containing protein [Thecamonas trahens ATCC 50062]KNC52788.1 papain family cysteine protease containing protein [Thecamonas trahens ATCC 50062]|eukprot:XP_013755098.1 papain family cysteine protease containing protein [Thecamonas trahens ATCC 50062]